MRRLFLITPRRNMDGLQLILGVLLDIGDCLSKEK